jgi:hypothetical protein
VHRSVYQPTPRRHIHRIKLDMGATLSSATIFLSVTLCDGSSRKLIAGWWYVIWVSTELGFGLALL